MVIRPPNPAEKGGRVRTGAWKPTDFWELATPQFVRAMMWVALAPLILLLRRQIPLHRGYWVGGTAFHLLFSFVVLAVGHGLDTTQRYLREELKSAQLETRLIKTELQALRQQLHPHFLFTTLNTAAVLIREQKHEEVVIMLARLGFLLRMPLDQNCVSEVSPRQEMDSLGRYIKIQHLRFSDRLSVGIDIAEEPRSSLIPNFLLQPIAENPILQGVAPMAGPGRVDITGRNAGARQRHRFRRGQRPAHRARASALLDDVKRGVLP